MRKSATRRAHRSGRSPHVRHGIALPHRRDLFQRGQKYEPVDVNTLLYYKEAKDGQILEEGITEAGSMGSFIAAGSAYATHGINTIPFSFTTRCSVSSASRISSGPQRICARGLHARRHIGTYHALRRRAPAQDGNSQILALPSEHQSLRSAFAYEIAVIIQDGIRRMYKDGENVFYYITVMNEPYAMPPMPGDVKDGILRGCTVSDLRPTGKQSCARNCLEAARFSTKLCERRKFSRLSMAWLPMCGA